jgi:hypothetical protein
MEKKLSPEIYQLIISKNALKGRLMEANDRSELSIIRWAKRKSEQLTLPHNIDIIYNFYKDNIDISASKEELFDLEKADIA